MKEFEIKKQKCDIAVAEINGKFSAQEVINIQKGWEKELLESKIVITYLMKKLEQAGIEV